MEKNEKERKRKKKVFRSYMYNGFSLYLTSLQMICDCIIYAIELYPQLGYEEMKWLFLGTQLNCLAQ